MQVTGIIVEFYNSDHKGQADDLVSVKRFASEIFPPPESSFVVTNFAGKNTAYLADWQPAAVGNSSFLKEMVVFEAQATSVEHTVATWFISIRLTAVSEEFKELEDKILSTFKFIEP